MADPALGPAQYNTWNDYIEDFNRAQRNARFMDAYVRGGREVDEHLARIQAAKQFIAQRDFDRDIKSGIPVAEAITRHPSLWSGDSAMIRSMAEPKIPLGKRVDVPGTGGFLMGVGSNQAQFVRPESPLTPYQKVSVIQDERAALRREMSDDLPPIEPPGDSPYYERWHYVRSRLQELDDILNTTSPGLLQSESRREEASQGRALRAQPAVPRGTNQPAFRPDMSFRKGGWEKP